MDVLKFAFITDKRANVKYKLIYLNQIYTGHLAFQKRKIKWHPFHKLKLNITQETVAHIWTTFPRFLCTLMKSLPNHQLVGCRKHRASRRLRTSHKTKEPLPSIRSGAQLLLRNTNTFDCCAREKKIQFCCVFTKNSNSESIWHSSQHDPN